MYSILHGNKEPLEFKAIIDITMCMHHKADSLLEVAKQIAAIGQILGSTGPVSGSQGSKNLSTSLRPQNLRST